MEKRLLRACDRFRGVMGSLGWLLPTLARLTLGLVFIAAGWGKLHSLPEVTEFFITLKIPFPGFNAHLVAATELVAGGLVLVGLAARLAALPLVVTMVVAIVTAKLGDVHGLSDLFGLQEVDYIVLAIVVAVLGAGPLSLDRLLRVLTARSARV